MSSILQALKKVEQEAATHSETQPPLLSKAWPSRRPRAFGAQKRVSWLTVFIVMGALTALGLGWQHHMSRPNEPIDLPLAAGDRLPRDIATEPSLKLTAQDRASVSSQSSRLNAESGFSSPAASEEPRPEKGKQVARTGGSRSLPRAETPANEIEFNNPDSGPREPRTSVFSSSTSSDVPLAKIQQQKKKGFVLQALVWSEESTECWAMVNGRSVRTGDFVNQARVTHIGQNHIIFEKNGTKWKHPLQNQSPVSAH